MLLPVSAGPILSCSMRDDYIKEALKSVPDPNLLINVVSRRVKQLKHGSRPLVGLSLRLSPTRFRAARDLRSRLFFARKRFTHGCPLQRRQTIH